MLDPPLHPVSSSAAPFLTAICAEIQPPLIASPPATRTLPQPAATPARCTSRRLAGQPAAGLSTIERARSVLRKKWGIAGDLDDKATEEAMMQNFIDMFKEPLSADEIEAVKALFSSVQLTKGRPSSKGRPAAVRRLRDRHGSAA